MDATEQTRAVLVRASPGDCPTPLHPLLAALLVKRNVRTHRALVRSSGRHKGSRFPAIDHVVPIVQSAR